MGSRVLAALASTSTAAGELFAQSVHGHCVRGHHSDSEGNGGVSSPLKAPLFENESAFRFYHILLICTTTDNGMGSAFNEGHALDLGKRSLSTGTSMPTTCPRVLGCISYIFYGSVNGHETQAKQERSSGLRRCQRFTNGVKERHQRFRAQLIAPVG